MIAGPPITYLITSGDADPGNFDSASRSLISLAASAADVGIDLIQVREKHLPARMLYEMALNVVRVTRGTRSRVLINDRLDIALASGADGVHLTAGSLPVATVREKAPAGFLIACSTHSLDEILCVQRDGGDVCVFGPVFETPGKGEAVGRAELRRVCDAVDPFPVIALGGVDEGNCLAAVEAGAAGIAAIRGLDNVAKMNGVINKLAAWQR